MTETMDLHARMVAFQAVRRPLEAAAQIRLMQSGYFTEVTGPAGGIPIQATGRLRTGEAFAFRARVNHAEIELNGRVVSRVCIGEDFLCAGQMTPDEAATHILGVLASLKG